MMQQHVDETKAIMQTNIENILERGERIEELQEEANSLNQAAKVFKKKAKKVRRFKMMQDAKHGVCEAALDGQPLSKQAGFY